MPPARVTVTGATGLIGRSLTEALRAAGAETTVLSRDGERAANALPGVTVQRWDPSSEDAPEDALAGRDAIVHLTGEPIAQRWSGRARRAIRDSRVAATRRLVAGLQACEPRPAALVCASGVGYYGHRGQDPLDEDAAAGGDFLAQVCVEWEREAQQAGALGIRVVRMRTGVVLAPSGGALASMLGPFRLGLGGPVGDGRQYLSWIHLEDLVALYVAALEDERFSGPINATAPEPVMNREFARALGAALHRPARLPVPRLALRVRYGEMSEIITTGARVLPARALMLGFRFRHESLEEALRSVLAVES